MKTLNYILSVALFAVLFSCNSSEKQSELPVIDVTKSYPKKDIVLQDIADVEYIPLETTDSVLLGNCSVVPAGEHKVLAYDMRSGDIFIFDTNGKFVNKFNHKGQSGQEYLFTSKVFVDSSKDEIFVVDGFKNSNIQVYTMQGEYKRTLKLEDVLMSSNFTNFGTDEILCYQDPNRKNVFAENEQEYEHTNVTILDKETGEVDSIIKLPTTKGVTPFCFFDVNGRKAFMIVQSDLFVETQNGIIINEVACDTIFLLNKEKKMLPVLARTPKVSPSDEPLVMLGIEAITDNAFFMETILKEYDKSTQKGFDRKKYVLEKATNEIFEYSLKNNLIENEEKGATLKPLSLIPVFTLKEWLEEGKLKGKLKEIVEKLDADDNPMLVRVKLK